MNSPALLRTLRAIPGPADGIRTALLGAGADLDTLAKDASARARGTAALAEELRRQVQAAIAGGLRLKRLLARANEVLRARD